MHLLVKNIKCWIPNHVQKPGNTYTAVSLMIISSIFGSPTWCSYAPIHGLDLVIMTKAWNLDIYILQMMVFGIVARKYELSWLIGSIKAEQFRVGQARCQYNEWWCIYKNTEKLTPVVDETCMIKWKYQWDTDISDLTLLRLLLLLLKLYVEWEPCMPSTFAVAHVIYTLHKQNTIGVCNVFAIIWSYWTIATSLSKCWIKVIIFLQFKGSDALLIC